MTAWRLRLRLPRFASCIRSARTTARTRCAVLVTVDDDGRAVKVQGDPSQPVTQGFLCGKVAKYLDRVYAPDRILYPLRAQSRRGEGSDCPAAGSMKPLSA